MECPKCKAINRPEAKFCTICSYNLGVHISAVKVPKGTNCANCGISLKPEVNFCPSCAAPVKNQVLTPTLNRKESADIMKTMSVIKDRIFWNINSQQGEVAHRFNEAELMQYDDARGIIINENTTAFIRANGVQVAEIKGGVYDFVEPQKLDQALNRRDGGVAGTLRRGYRFLTNLVLGRRLKDTFDNNQISSNAEAINSMNRLIERMKKGDLFSVTLKLDKSFPLFFEIPQIETKILDTTFGVHAFFKIGDFQKFSEYYLGDSTSVSMEKIKSEIQPLVKAAIQEIMHDIEIAEGKIPNSILQNIKSKIESTSHELFYGLQLEKIVEISSKSEDLQRIREINRELYLAGKELDNLIRTNEFRNRLSLTANATRLNDARNDAEFYKELTAINNSRQIQEARSKLDLDNEIKQDRLLSEEEFEKFFMVLTRERRIREAKNEDEINLALLEIEKTGLIREEDLENLKLSISERKEDHDKQRFHSIALLQMNQSLEIDRKSLEWEYEIGDKNIDLDISRRRKELQAELGYTQLEIERWKTENDYKDSFFYKNLEKQKTSQLQQIEINRASRESEIYLDNKEISAQLERLHKLKDIEAAEIRLQHEQEMAKRLQELNHLKGLSQIEKEKQESLANIYKGMTFEQIMAANPNLSPEVATQLAKKFEMEAEAEKYKAEVEKIKFGQLQNDTRVQDNKEMMDRLERMFNKGLDSSAAMTSNLMEHKDQQKDEYKKRLEKQEDRIDKTQDKALDYTVRNNSFGNNNPMANIPPVAPPISKYFVDLPGQQNIPRDLNALIDMVKNGEISTFTNIFSRSLNTWIAASNISELKPYLLSDSNAIKENPLDKSLTCKHCESPENDLNQKFCWNCGKPWHN